MVCAPGASGAKVVADPVVVFEVLSESTAREDLFAGNAEYRATPSIQRYIILEQTQAAAVVFYRRGEDWISEVVTDEGVLRMPEIGIDVPLAEFYVDIDLADRTEKNAAT